MEIKKLLFYMVLCAPAYTLASPLACEDIFFKVPNSYSAKVSDEARSLALENLGKSIEQLATDLSLFNAEIAKERQDLRKEVSYYSKSLTDIITRRLEERAKYPPNPNILKWRNFEALEAIKTDVEAYSNRLNSMSEQQRSNERRRALLLFQEHPQIRIVFEYLENNPQKKYAPTEYDLKRDFLTRILDIVRILPPDFRPNISRIPKDQRTTEINNHARKLIKKLDQTFNNLFQSTGFRDYAHFTKSLYKSKDPNVIRALEIVDNNNIEFVIRRPENGRFWIPKLGIQNQFITGSSKGALNFGARNRVESMLLKENLQSYEKLDPEIKPKYGLMEINQKQGIPYAETSSRQYGSDFYYLKTEAVKDRISFVPGDSLDNSLIKNLENSLKSFERLFIPWAKKHLLVPYIVKAIENNNYTGPTLSRRTSESLGLNHDKWQNKADHYLEFQVFGRIDLTMVKAFKFTQEPPTGEFLLELQKHNIEIIDGSAK